MTPLYYIAVGVAFAALLVGACMILGFFLRDHA